jgi:hypothetical protein
MKPYTDPSPCLGENAPPWMCLTAAGFATSPHASTYYVPKARKPRVAVPRPEGSVSIAAAAEAVGMTEQTLYYHVRSGHLPSTLAGKRYAVRIEDVRYWIEHRDELGAEAHKAAGRARAAARAVTMARRRRTAARMSA